MDIKTISRKILRWTKRIVLGILLFVLFYVVSAFILSVIPVGKKDRLTGNDVEVYILSNGVHMDMVLPIKNSYKDWSRDIRFDHTISRDTTMEYLAFGWGDKGFYLETPEWSDLKFSVAFKAMFYLGTSAMHCTFYKNMREGSHCKKLVMSQDAYQKLVTYIEESFQHNAYNELLHIKDNSYGNNDAFYEAKRVYNLFYTCNTWANNALKSCGQKACLWTPSDKGMFYHY